MTDAHFPELDYVPYFDKLIRIQEEAIVSYKRLTGTFILIGAGIILTVIFFHAKIEGLTAPIIGLGSLFIGGSVAFPFREISPRRSRIETYLHLRQGFERHDLSEAARNDLKLLASETMKRWL